MPTVQFYLAFANPPARPLPELAREARELRNLIGVAAGKRLCGELKAQHVREFCGTGDLFEMFRARPPDEAGVLHFAGHGGPDALELTSGIAGAEPLASFLGRQNLALVFLNACSTRAQAQALIDAGARAVVVTSRAIRDVVAADFAAAFYGGLCSGRDVDTSFLDARDFARATHGPSAEGWFGGGRDLVARPKASPAPVDLPWELIKRRPEDGRWNVLSAGGNWLALLPDLPPAPLPSASPFVGLRPYRAAEAALFFGRGRDVWDLYRCATQRPFERILLVFGRTGAGKSSVLEAGLAPRLRAEPLAGEQRRAGEVHLLRLDGGLTPLPALRDLLGATGEGEPLGAAWRRKEEESGKTVYVVLDQVEEVFLRAGERESEEWAVLVAALRGLGAAGGPRGKLLLGFREEYYGRVAKDLEAAGLPFAEKEVKPLHAEGVEEAVEGPMRTTY